MNVIDVFSRVFNKHSSDHTREITFYEFCEIWRELGLKGENEDMRMCFDMVDPERRGYIGRNAFVSTIRENVTKLKILFFFLLFRSIIFEEKYYCILVNKSFDARRAVSN